MRLKIDEDLPAEAAEFFSTAGHDATTVVAQGMGGGPDGALAHACRREARALLPLDLDFADIHAYPPNEHAGLIVLRPSSQSKTHVMKLLARVDEHVRIEPPTGRLWIVDESGIRIRQGDDQPA